jgi:tetratricopeptide (TPR) repeat protein
VEGIFLFSGKRARKCSIPSSRKKPMGLIGKFGSIWKTGKTKPEVDAEKYLDLVRKEPGNAKAHLKLAEFFQRKGDKQKAISEYLLAADIFAKNSFYARAMAIYKQLPKQDPSLDHVYLKIADIYRKMGFLGDAFAQYRILVQHYDSLGKKDKALEVMKAMADLDPRKTTAKEKSKGFKTGIQMPELNSPDTGQAEATPEAFLGGPKKGAFFDLGAELEAAGPMEMKDFVEVSNADKISGVDEIFKQLKETGGPNIVDPDFNFNLGVACREMGFFDDAVEQFEIALKGGQNIFDSGIMLGLCFKDMGKLDEACQMFEKVLNMEGIPQDKRLNAEYELGLIYKDQGKTEKALDLLRQISTVDQDFRDTKNEIMRLKGGRQSRGGSSRK